MEALVADKFFGFVLEKLYLEIYALGYNEYLKAVAVLKESLVEEFPERKEAVEIGCIEMLREYSEEYENVWFKKFMTHCKSSLFVVPPQVPVYDPELEKVKENQQAREIYANLHHSIMANKYFNLQLIERLRKLEDEITERKVLLAKLASTESLMKVLKKSNLIEQKIRAVVQLPEDVLDT